MSKPRIIVTDVAPHGQGLAVSGKTCSWGEMVDYINAEQSNNMESGEAGDVVWAVSTPKNWHLVEWMKKNMIAPINEVWVTPPASPGDVVFIRAEDDCWWKMEIKGKGGVK